MTLLHTLLVGGLAAVAATAVDLRGVPPAETALYIGEQFACNGGAKVIPITSVNDDYCDCLDGKDEPGTSACNYRFYCENAGHKPKFVPSSRVNDGICDCCGGTDEWRTGVCQNTCWELGQEYRAEMEAKVQQLKEGISLKASYVSSGRAAAAEARDRLAAFKTQLEDTRLEIQQLEAEEKAARAAEEARLEEESLRVSAVADVESDAARAGEDVGFFDEDTFEDEELAADFEEFFGNFLADVHPEVPVDSALPEEPAQPVEKHALTQALEDAESRLQSARAREKDLHKQIDMLEKQVTVDMGDESEWMHVFKQNTLSFTTRDAKYTYEVKPFVEAHQREGKAGPKTLLGKFKGWEVKEGRRMAMQYQDGQSCWNGPKRSLSIQVECGSSDEIYHVEEPEKCTYVMRMRSPAACLAEDLETLQRELTSYSTRQSTVQQPLTAIPRHDEL